MRDMSDPDLGRKKERLRSLERQLIKASKGPWISIRQSEIEKKGLIAALRARTKRT